MSNRVPLHLHIPAPRARPGDKPDFSHVAVAEAGATRRPDALAPADEMRDMPYALVRVMDGNARAVGPWDPRLDSQTLRRGLRAMLLARLFDEHMIRAQRQGKTSFFVGSAGEEALGAAPSMALGQDDMCFPTYRLVSWLMARDYPLLDLVNQVFSNAKDKLKGRQLPTLYSARAYGFYSLSGNVGSRFGHAVGWAMASAYKGDERIAIAYIGEGTTAEGDFHEALTFASVYRAPVILCIVNNQWAISSFQGIAGGEAAHLRCARHRLWAARPEGGWQRLPGRSCRDVMGGRPRALPTAARHSSSSSPIARPRIPPATIRRAIALPMRHRTGRWATLLPG